MDIKKIKTLGELRKSGYHPKSVKEELRSNLIRKLQNKEETFSGIIGYEESVMPEQNALALHKFQANGR